MADGSNWVSRFSPQITQGLRAHSVAKPPSSYKKGDNKTLQQTWSVSMNIMNIMKPKKLSKVNFITFITIHFASAEGSTSVAPWTDPIFSMQHLPPATCVLDRMGHLRPRCEIRHALFFSEDPTPHRRRLEKRQMVHESRWKAVRKSCFRPFCTGLAQNSSSKLGWFRMVADGFMLRSFQF